MGLAALGAGALAWRGLALTGAPAAVLGPFADGLDLAMGLLVTLLAMSLTGGLTSELYVLLLVDLVLARDFLGPAASRFLSAATVLGLALLVTLGRGLAPDAVSLGPTLRFLWPLLLLAAMESWTAASRLSAREETAPSPAATASPVVRDGREELLHDLRSPLTVIRLYTDLVAESTRAGEPAPEEYLENLRSEVAMMESLLGVTPSARGGGRARARAAEDSLEGERRRPERADLVKILGTLAASYRLAHAGRLRIEFMAERPELPVMADVLALQRAFRNVLDNAVKYTPAGGQVRIRAGASGGQAFVVISDTGVGMSPADRARAFEFSYRGEAAQTSGAIGRGLGLGLSRELLEANGGSIALSSEPGRGSEVTIAFPLPREGRG